MGPAHAKYKELCKATSPAEKEKFNKMLEIFFDYLIETKITNVHCGNKLYEIHPDILETNE